MAAKRQGLVIKRAKPVKRKVVKTLPPVPTGIGGAAGSSLRKTFKRPEANYFASAAKHNLQFIGTGCRVLDHVFGGGYVLGRMANIVGDKCLSGNTIVSVSRGGKPKKMTIETLYNRVNGKHPNRNAGASTMLLSDLGGYVGLHKMVSVQKTGNKVLYEVLTEDGHSILVSEDHKFKTSKGWKSIATGLSKGTQVHCWRGKQTGKEDRADRAVTYSIPNHPHGWQHVIAGKNYKRMSTARLVIEAAMNNIGLDDFIRILRTNPDAAANLAYSDPSFEVHHLDGNPVNDALKNLELLPSQEHWGKHSEDMRRDTNRTVLCRVTSVKRVKNAPTYDITMESPYNNFIGDGFVVHNSSGKTLLAIEACANFIRDYPKGHVRYAEAEAAFDKDYAEALGMPVKSVEFAKNIFTVEDFFEDIEKVCKESSKNKPILYVLDSLDALSDRAEKDRKIDEGTYNLTKQKKLGELFRRKIQDIETSNICLIIISQIRDKIGVTFGETKMRAGGKAMDFYASQVVWLSEVQKLKKTIDKVDRVTGIQVRAKCKKNKIGLPFRECDFPLLFGYGVDDLTANVEWLIASNRADRLKELGLSVAGYKIRIHNVRNNGGTEMDLLRQALNKVVDEVWIEIETSFLPKSKKY